MNTIKVIIDDENRYFYSGLALTVDEYAKHHNRTIRFLSPCDKEPADLVITSLERYARRWRRKTGPGAGNMIVIEDIFGAHRCNAGNRIYRTDKREVFYDKISHVLAREGFCKDTEKELILTWREKQVINYLKRGVSQSQIARLLGISVKTVHSHKRAVMSKLMLGRYHDFIFWLLRYGDNKG
ncbi:TPA: response regulator transcription factor [Serratia marcescens]|nr:response regulator transcription factor [Serratia marcescens]